MLILLLQQFRLLQPDHYIAELNGPANHSYHEQITPHLFFPLPLCAPLAITGALGAALAVDVGGKATKLSVCVAVAVPFVL